MISPYEAGFLFVFKARRRAHSWEDVTEAERLRWVYYLPPSPSYGLFYCVLDNQNSLIMLTRGCSGERLKS